MVSKVAIICLAVLLVMCLSEVDAKKEGKGKGKEGKGKGNWKKCLGVDLEYSEESKTAKKSCRKNKDEKKEESEDEGEKGEGKKGWKRDPCFLDCIYRKSELITSDGKLDGDKIDAGIKKTYPEAAQAGILADEQECRKLVTETLTTDNNCKTFQEYGKCHWKAIKKNCKKEEKKEE